MSCAYQSAGVGAIEAEERDRRLGVSGLRGGGVASRRGERDARSCHAGRAGCDTTGEHVGCG